MVNMTLKYRMIADKHSKPDRVVGGSSGSALKVKTRNHVSAYF
jgi:hypothetical protein